MSGHCKIVKSFFDQTALTCIRKPPGCKVDILYFYVLNNFARDTVDNLCKLFFSTTLNI